MRYPMKYRSIFSLLTALCIGVMAGPSSAASAPDVVVSIKPVHSLVEAVMEGVGEPELIIQGGASPHGYQMRPSQASALNRADIIIWIGESMERFLTRPIANLGNESQTVALTEVSGISLLRFREGAVWADDDEHGHDEHGHDEHGHDEHGHDEHGHDEHDHAGEIDGHLWLDPANSRRIVEHVADLLARQDPERAATYQRNKIAVIERIDALEMRLRSRLAAVRDRPFLVFHDAYQYFERAFDLEGLGAITLGPERRPSARRLTALRNALVEHDIACVFTEPQFRPDLAFTVIEGTKTRTAEIDPIGADIEAGPDAWFDILDRLGTTIADCLSAKG